ncbi:hypothetical protein IT779_04890 [Nocardia sp. NEAU-351]|uniref:Uncharacterized protein n=1 Tax=Nocardia bovistercoris TaxID=2785916 RepID=A0A931MZ06_9NOCA|nr:hypothetical protein [Nocardia bovistercoris]
MGFGRSSRADRGAVARLRGGSAGALSGALALAAHGWASGAMSPDSTTVALLVAVCAVVGAVVTGLGPLRETAAGLVAALFGGQLLGHVAMGFGSGHLHHGDTQLTPRMIFAHLLAAFAAAALIRGAEAAYRIGTAVLARVVPVGTVLPVVAEPAPLRTTHRDRVVLRILAAESLRTRGPPMLVRL